MLLVEALGHEPQRPWHADEHIGGGEFASDVLDRETPFGEIYAGVELCSAAT